MSNRIDTDQLLDRCADCGARARITESFETLLARVLCTECANAIVSQETKYLAAIAWNQEQRRKVKAKND